MKENYILIPVSVFSDVNINNDPFQNNSFPKFEIQVKSEKIEFQLRKRQIKKIIETLKRLEAYEIRKKYRKFRPQGIVPGCNPLLYWKFAIQANLAKLREKRFSWSIRSLNVRRERRLQYIKHYQQHLIYPSAVRSSSLSPPLLLLPLLFFFLSLFCSLVFFITSLFPFCFSSFLPSPPFFRSFAFYFRLHFSFP